MTFRRGCSILTGAVLVAALHMTAAAGEIPSGQTTNSCGCGGGAEQTADAAVSSPTSSPASQDIASSATGTAAAAEEKRPEPLEPLFVRSLVPVEAGRNDANPVWSPRGTFIAFERSVGDAKDIRITLADGTPVQTVSFPLSGGGGDMKFFLPGISEETSYNAGIAWSPDEYRFVFMSNGGEGNYDVYLQDLGAATPVRLTDHKEKDGQAHWSPAGDRIVFVSGRSGNGDVYGMDLGTRVLSRLTRGGKPWLYPRWSPDGSRLVAMHGSNENHDIILISGAGTPAESQRALTKWTADDLRPVWSPDGKKIAFYTNFNAAGDPRTWSLAVIAADGSDPAEGEGLAACIVATDIIPDVEAGPAWMPDSSRIVFVKNDRHEYNPLYVADVVGRTTVPIRTDTKMNHDVAISAEGAIAFRAQVNQWDQIFIMKLKE